MRSYTKWRRAGALALRGSRVPNHLSTLYLQPARLTKEILMCLDEETKAHLEWLEGQAERAQVKVEGKRSQLEALGVEVAVLRKDCESFDRIISIIKRG